jgi:hypothetical protein
MMLNYTDIQSYVDAGLTDAEIAAALQASGITPRRIAIAELLFELNNRAMLIRLIRPADTGEKWSGTVVNMILYINENGTPEQVTAVNQWFSHITNDRNSYYDTTVVSYAKPLWEMRNQFGGQPGMPSVEDFDAIAALGGGWRFVDVIAEDVAACKAQQEKIAAIDQCRTDMASILQPVQAKSSAVNAWLDALDTSGMTVAEVEAYCASLLASEDGNP